MFRLSFVFMLVLCFFSFSYAEPENTKQELTIGQKQEIAKDMGIILPGMTKEEVRKTFGLLEPKIGFSAATGQEVWYYSSPEEQNIYFTDDLVERVEYIPEKKLNQQQELKQLEEI